MNEINRISPSQPGEEAPRPSVAGAGRPVSRAGGLYLAPKGHMTPSFGLLTLFLVLDVASFVGPYYASRFSDSLWGSADRMGFLARAMASALAFGFVAAVAAERRNHSSWWFLLGHAGFPLALIFSIFGFDVAGDRGLFDPRGSTGAAALVIATGFLGTVATLVATRKPRPALTPIGPGQGAICRLMYQWGNIWFGITLMVAIGTTVAAGTFIENSYGTKGAQYLVYKSPWFGAIFFTGGVSMLCATFRKYPFRLEQAGWLTVHSGLAMVVIGAMMSFLSSVDGEVTIKEGESAEAFRLSTQTRLSVDEIVMRPNGSRTTVQLLRTIADFDVDPTKTEPGRVYDIETGEGPLQVVIDRYFGLGEPYARWTDDGATEKLGIELELVMGRSPKKEVLRLDEENQPQTQLPLGGMNFELALFRATKPMLDALLRTAAPKDHGAIVVTDAAGKQVLTIPVEPPQGERAGETPAALQKTVRIPGTEADVRLVAYYDNLRPARNRSGVVDATPGNPINPAVTVEIAGQSGVDQRTVYAFMSDEGADVPASNPANLHPYRLSYACEPRIDVAGPGLLFVDVNGRLTWVFASTSGERTSGEVKAGDDLPLPMPALKIRPTAVYRHLHEENGYEFKGYKAENQVIRLTIKPGNGTPAAPVWLPLGSRRMITVGMRNLILAWSPTVRPLGFSLKLNDFHRDFYPGTTEESSFESYCLLRHPEKFPAGEDIKIDMNHPLRLDGWRLFQSRFGRDDRTTILQVNRDPGLVITYPACAVVLLGLVVVFFMKNTLRLKRKELELRGAPPSTHLAWAFGSVAAVGIGPLLFGLYAATHEGLGLPLSGWPSFAFGVIMLIAIPIAVVWIYVRPLSRRITSVISRPAPSGALT